MNKEDLTSMFAIPKEIKRSFENPVILLTMKDYAEDIFNCLVDLRTLQHQNATLERIAEIVNTFHINWVQAVQDIENFKKRVKDTPREAIQKSFDFTVECLHKRQKYIQKYIEQVTKNIPETETSLLEADVEIIEDMREIVNFSLIEKQRCLQFSSDKSEFYSIILNETEELLNWLDSLYDHLAIQSTKILGISELPTDLNKILQQIIDEVARLSTPEALTAVNEMCRRSRTLGYIDRVKTSINDLEIKKVVDKIKQLEDRIARMKAKSSSTGIMALEHKTIFLEERLESLENLKVSLNFLRTQSKKSDAGEYDGKSTNKEEDKIHIFNHLLPHQERCRLVERLVEHWQSSLGWRDGKSFVSILSATDLKEIFSDELGHFTVDKYGRKIYTVEGTDEVHYQLNERNELVSVKDDDKHVYFYDECGRYYLTDRKERVYKAYPAASEYLLHRSGFMLKVAEVVDGIEYKYDNLGRYHIDEHGGHIYRDKDSTDEYRPDGLGNLVMIRNEDPYYEPCPIEPSFIEESKYLKEVVGAALKKCLAEVVMVQPTDPVNYLADSLEKYRNSVEARQKRMLEEELMMAERERQPKEHESLSHSLSVAAESVEDYNFAHYVSNGIGRE